MPTSGQDSSSSQGSRGDSEWKSIFSSLSEAPNTKLQDDLDFPNELWFKIMAHLSTAELYSLGCSARCLNSLVTHHFWQSRTSHDSDGDSTRSLTLTINCPLRRSRLSGQSRGRLFRSGSQIFDDLDILTIMLDPPSIDELSCEFNSTEAFLSQEFPWLSQDYDQLSRFISRVPGLGNIKIELERHHEKVCERTGTDEWISRTNALERLFNTCIEKGCSGFQVFSGHRPANTSTDISPTHFRLVQLVDSVIPTKKRLIFSEDTTRVGKGWRVYTSWKGEGKIPPPSLMLAQGNDKSTKRHSTETKVESKLTSLGIHANLLVIPPFSNWSYQLIATSPSLTTLSISTVHNLGGNLCEVILTWLAEALRFHNSLKSLTIENSFDISLDSVMWFINELGGSVEELTVVGWYYHRPFPARLHKKFDGKVTSTTMKSIKAQWGVLSWMVGMEYGTAYSSQGEKVMVELMKERFPALERLEIENQSRIIEIGRV